MREGFERIISLAGGQAELAKKAGYSQPSISRFLNHEHPPIMFCAAMVVAVGGAVSLADIVDKTELSLLFKAVSMSRKAKRGVDATQSELF